jgi:amidase
VTREEYRACDATALAALIRTGAVSQAEVLEAARREISISNPAVNAVIAEFEPPSDTGPDDAPFAGVPFLLKDIGAALRGARTGCASRLFQNAPVEAVDDVFT